MPEDNSALKPLVNPLNKNVKYDLTKLTPEYVDNANLGTAGIDTKSFSKEDLGGQDIKSFQKETNTGTSILNKQILTDQQYFNDIKEKNATIKNDINAYNQGTLDKIGNGVVKFGGRVYTSVMGSTVGTLYGLYSWGRDGEFKSFYDNEFQRSLDGVNDYLSKEFKHYYTSTKDDWEVGNFIFDKVFDGLGFATGAVLSSLIGGSVTSAIQKSFQLTGLMKSAAVKTLKETAKDTFTQQAIATGKAVNKIQNITNVSKNLPKSLVSLTTGAVYESGVEARHGYSETRELLVSAYKQTHEGREPSGDDLKEINKLSGETANGIFAANMAIVGGGNILQFGKHIGLDFADLKKIWKSPIAKQVVDGTGKKTFVSSSGSLGKSVRAISSVVKNPIVESQEEMMQSVVTGTGTDYALTKYNNQGKADVGDLLDSSIKAFKKTYNSKEGWEEGLIGAIVGSTGVIAPSRVTQEDGTKKLSILKGGIYESVKDYRTSEAKRNEIISNLNDKGSVTSLKEGITHHIRDSRLEKIKDEAIALDNEMVFKSAQDDQFHSAVTARIEAGMFDSVMDDINEQRSIPLDDFKKGLNIPEGIEYTEETKAKQLDSFERRAKAIKKSTEFVDKIYQGGNPAVRESLIYNQSMINRIEERMNTLSRNIQDLTGGASVAINTVNEKGEKLSKKEIFNNIPRDKEIHRKEFEQMYDDYNALDTRANLMLNELQELLDPKEESKAEAKIKEAIDKFQKDEELKQAKKDKAKKQDAAEQKAETVKKQKTDKVKEKEVILNLFKTLNSADINEGEPIQLSPEDIAIVVKNINALTNKKDVHDFLEKVEGNFKSLPLEIQDAIVKKVEKYANELTKLVEQEIDPLNASGTVKQDEATKQDINNKINEGEDITPEPIDISKIDGSEIEEENSNAGQTTTGIENQEVREDGKEIYTIDGRLLNVDNTLATSTIKYVETANGIKQLEEVNEKANLDVLSAEILQEGDAVTVHLYTGKTLEIFNGDGTVKEEKENVFGVNQIMEVRDSNNILIGYIHDEAYITDKRVYPTIGKEDNLELNRIALQKTRAKIFKHISETNTPYTTTIKGKNIGSPMLTARFNKSIAEVIEDDKKPQIVTITDKGLFIGGNPISDTELAGLVYDDFSDEFYQKYKGANMIAIPGANGKYLLRFVRNPKLVDKPHIKKLISDVLKAFINQDEKFLSSLDIENTPEAIQSYLNNFIFATNTKESNNRLSLYFDENNQPLVRFRDIEGSATVLRLDVNGKLTNLKQLEQRLDAFQIAVNLSKQTEDASFISMNKEGVRETIKYSKFIKQNLNTNLMSTLIRGGKERSYVANPLISLDFNTSTQIGVKVETIEVKEDVLNEVSQVKPDSTTTNNKKQKPASLKNSSLGKTIVDKKGVNLQKKMNDISDEEAQTRKKNCE